VTIVREGDSEDSKILFRLKHVIDHAPAVTNDNGIRFGAANIQTSFLLEDNISTKLNSLFTSMEDNKPVVLDTDVAFDGTVKHRLFVGSFDTRKLKTDDNTVATFGGMNYALTIGGNKIIGQGSIGNIDIATDDLRASITPGTMAMDMEKIAESVYSGEANFSIETMTFDKNDLPFALDMEDINISLNSEADDKTFDSKMDFSIGHIDSSLPLNDASLTLGVKNLPLKEFSQFINLSTDSFVAEDKKKFRFDFDIANALGSTFGLFGASAGIFYDFGVSNDDGEVNSSFDLSVVDDTSPHFLKEDVVPSTTGREFLNMLEAEYTFSADQAAIQGSSLEDLLNKKDIKRFIVKKNNTYQSLLSLKELTLEFNNRPLSLELVLSDALDQTIGEMVNAKEI